MKATTSLVAPLVVLILALGVGVVMTKKTKGGFQDKQLIVRGLDTPTVWVFLDSSDVNSRQWSDFGARSNRVMNIPLLNLCYESIVKATGTKYHVEVLSGASDVAERLGGWEMLPPSMRNSLRPLGSEEMMFLRTAILAKYGGLWVPVSTVCMREIPSLPSDKAAFFGTDPNETYAGPSGTLVPNTEIMWSPQPSHPIFVQWRNMLYTRLAEDHGGKQVRRDSAWDWTYVTGVAGKDSYVVYPYGELNRKAGGKRIELEDLFASGTEGRLPFEIREESIFIRIPFEELKQRRIFGWVLRSTEQQIKDSDIAIKYLL